MWRGAGKAVEAIKDYDQAQTDKLVYEAAKIIYQHAAELAREAVDETGLGYYEDKICKNTDTPAAFWAYLRDKKSVGIISENKETGIIEVAHPVGGDRVRDTGDEPKCDPAGELHGRGEGEERVIVSPAPRAAKSTTHTGGADPGGNGEVRRPGRPDPGAERGDAGELTGADGGVRPGDRHRRQRDGEGGVLQRNAGIRRGPREPPVVLDRGYDLKEAAKMTVTAVGSDNGILCDGDNLLLLSPGGRGEVLPGTEGRGRGAV